MKRAVQKFILVAGLLISCGAVSAATVSVPPAFDMSFADTHWAFVPLDKPAVPKIESSLGGNEIDAFILKKLQEQGLSFNEPADKRSLIRRVTYDLTGLPPSYEEVRAFLEDDSPQAYEKVVERLLASEAYGERWARHWLDVARYADTMGVFRQGRYPFSHTYRDYVIQAFNEDKPYDRFILEQIAADQLELGEDKSALAAMGFLTLGRTFFGRKDFIIDDQIDVITRGLQGLTVTCARCHDHKFDPIPTADYYSLHGIFASSGNPDVLPVIGQPQSESAYGSYLQEKQRIQIAIEKKSGEVIDNYLKEERALAGNYLNAVAEGKTVTDKEEFEVFAGSRKVRPEILRLWIDYLETEEARQEPVLREWFAGKDTAGNQVFYNELFAAALDPEKEGFEEVRRFLSDPKSPLNPDRKEVAKWIARKINGDVGSLTGEMKALAWTHPGSPIRAHVLADVEKPKNSPIYKRGDPQSKGDEVPRQYLQILTGDARQSFTRGSGRLELAEEIASEKNPLTARVHINRIWGWHMGSHIVDTPSDYGVRTAEPLHIDLLNWLASTFIESGWSTKAVHRLILHSKTYRQSSSPGEKAIELDPTNTLYHYFPKTRLDFESTRDTLLAVSGNLDRTVGGFPFEITDPKSNRRTVYSFIDRQEMPGVFRTFDHPSPEATSPARFETVVPQQALFLMNSPFTIEQAKQLALRTCHEAGDDVAERIKRSYHIVFQRDPSPEELADGEAFIEQFELEESGDSTLGKWELYSQVLLLSNELMFVD